MNRSTVRSTIVAAARFCIFLCLLLCGNSQALSPEKKLSQFAVASWQTDAGLPELAIQALLETSDGYLWVGTQEGLARFDGQHFTVFDHVNTPQLHSDFIESLVEDGQHSLWIGTENGIAVRRANGEFESMDHKEGLRLLYVTASARDDDGSVWIGGSGGFVHIVDGKIARSFDERDGLEDSQVSSLAVDGNGTLWIIAQGRLYRLKNGKVEKFSSGISNQEIVRLFTNRKRQLWALGNAASVFTLVGDHFEAWWPEGVPKSEHVQGIVEDRDGTRWFATNTNGLFRARAERGGNIVTEQAFNDLRFETIYEDSTGTIWLGTLGRGLMRLRDGSFSTLVKKDGLASDTALSVLADHSGDVWIGTLSGLTQLSGGTSHRFTTEEGLFANYVASLAVDRDGGMWVGMRGNVVDHLKDGKVDHRITLKAPLLSTVATAIVQDPQRRLWIGTNGAGVAEYTPQGLRYHMNTNGLTENFVNAMTEDSHGDVWVGTSNGPWRIRDGELETDPTSGSELAHSNISAIHEDARRGLWFGTLARGIFRIERGVVSHFDRAQGLPDDSINSVLDDDDGNLWLGSNRGIFRIELDQLDDVAAGRRDQFHVTQFGEADGMKTAETSSGTQPSAWRSDDGRLWFVSAEGVVVVDPKHIQRDMRPLKPIIESVRVNDVDVSLASDLRFPARTSRLEIRYTAPNLTSTNTSFRYRLSNFDDTWSQVGGERVARFVNVAPGTHRFEVQARRGDEEWSTATSMLSFYVAPAFYQTFWFFILIVLAILLALGLVHYLRVRWLRMESAVAEERRRLAGEIHDSLAQGFSAISVQIEAALGRMHRSPELAISHLKLASDVSRSSLSEARKSIWNLQTRHANECALIDAINAACEQILYGHDAKLLLAARGRVWKANPFAEHNLLRVAQEAVSNAIHHGHAHTIQIDLVYEFTRLVLTITDDGNGYDENVSPEIDRGYGLKNMQQRVDTIRGALQIRSAVGVGTRIEVIVPRTKFMRAGRSRIVEMRGLR